MFSHAVRLVLAQASVSVLPVLLFLFALELIDTYKLLTWAACCGRWPWVAASR